MRMRTVVEGSARRAVFGRQEGWEGREQQR